MARRAWRYWEPVFEADAVCPLHPVWPWGGHRRFAYDLVRWMRPARIGELGVHWGTSFFAFAQAIKDGRMPGTELIGVDTFEGEDHAGRYGPEVYETVQRVVREHFPRQKITLHRMFFRDALAHVEDGSLDLLHIDGLHTFEAVKDDFETWLPKVAPGGVVLFHDVAQDTGYGSTEYWARLSAEHPGFMFEHSWGLGVLFPKGDARLAELKRLALDDKLVVYPALARAERAVHEVRDLTAMADDRLETIKKQREQLGELRQQQGQAGAHERAVQRAEAAERLARERHEAMQAQSARLAERDERIESLTQKLEAARALAVERLESVRAAGARALAAERAAAKLEPRASAAEAARDELRARGQAAEERLARLLEQNAALRERAVAAETAAKSEREHARAGAESVVATLREQARIAAESRASLERLLAEMAEHVAALVSSRDKDREQAAAGLREVAEAVAEARRASEAAAATLARRLGRLGIDTELLAMRAEHLEEVVAEQRDRRAAEPAPEPDWLTGQAQQPRGARRSQRQ